MDRIIVTGDRGIDRFIYLEGPSDQPANLRDAWVNASRFWNLTLNGGAGTLLEYLKAMGKETLDPCEQPAQAESIYLLVRKAEEKAGDQEKGRWCVGKAIVAGERDYRGGKLGKCTFKPEFNNSPVVILDFKQGWVKRNRKVLPTFLRNRSYIIRTHDPCDKKWVATRKNKNLPAGIWFSPIQDMANGSLAFAGIWENYRERLIMYLKGDDTLWNAEKKEWLHYVIVQISYDGAFMVGPGTDTEGEIFIFKGDQPGSFARLDNTVVVAGGIVFVYSLVEALLFGTKINKEKIAECIEKGLARIREVVKQGYVGPVRKDKKSDWEFDEKIRINLPTKLLEGVETGCIMKHDSAKPVGDWQTCLNIVAGNDDEYRANTVFRLKKFVTASSEFAQGIIRLISRLENHINSGKDILSFAVFGGPGSGKSFLAEEIADSLSIDGSKFHKETFNISQFDEPSRLVDAFKQIQTISLQNKIPFILWDEFDTAFQGAPAGWLKYFLMPMQDAMFFDGTTKRALGKCIFVFIGGTYENESKFIEWVSTDEGKKQKGKDFHSRLDSSITISHLDLKESPFMSTDPAAKTERVFRTTDPAKLVRAVMIRTLLGKQTKVIFIAPDLLAYLLHVPLQHGVRSLQRIITASELRKAEVYKTIHLPSYEVLQLHVKPSEKDNHGVLVNDFLKQINCGNLATEPPIELKWKGEKK